MFHAPYVVSRFWFGQKLFLDELVQPEKRKAAIENLGFFEQEVEWYALVDTEEKHNVLHEKFGPGWYRLAGPKPGDIPGVVEWIGFLKGAGMMPAQINVNVRTVAVHEAKVTYLWRQIQREVLVAEDGSPLQPFERGTEQEVTFLSPKPIMRFAWVGKEVEVSRLYQSVDVTVAVGNRDGSGRLSSTKVSRRQMLYRGSFEKIPGEIVAKYADALAYMARLRTEKTLPVYALDGVIGGGDV